MFNKMKKMLSSIDADYADIRYENLRESKVVYNGHELSSIGTNSTDGYVIRVLKNGGMSSVAFTKESDAVKAIKSAVENAELIGKSADKPVRLAPTEVVKDDFTPNMEIDPRKISINEKRELLQKYNNIPLGYEKIVSTNMAYFDLSREKFFVNSEGSEIREELITTSIRGMVTSREGNLLQNLRIAAGGSNGYTSVLKQEDMFEKRSKIVIDLLKAEPIKGGTYNCITNPIMSGVFTHEAFGHFSEADIVENLPAMRQKMQIGAKLGNDILSITDNATQLNQLGFYKYDDEGVAVRPVNLIKNGVLTGRLHSRRTAAEFGEPLSGHNIAQDYRYEPIIRMGTIFIEPGTSTFDDLLQGLGDGLYICDPKGGQTSGENFTFGAQYGYIVKNGKIQNMIRDINISGNLYMTLKDISMIGNDYTLSTVGGCGKGQTNIRSCYGGPHVLINNLVLGGA